MDNVSVVFLMMLDLWLLITTAWNVLSHISVLCLRGRVLCLLVFVWDIKHKWLPLNSCHLCQTESVFRKEDILHVDYPFSSTKLLLEIRGKSSLYLMAKLQNILRFLFLREKNVFCSYQTAGNKLYILVQLFKSQNSALPKPSKIFFI